MWPQKLKLVLDINRYENQTEAHKTFCKLGKILFWHALKQKTPKWLENAMLTSSEVNSFINHHPISIKKDDYPNKRFKGYSLSLIISINET